MSVTRSVTHSSVTLAFSFSMGWFKTAASHDVTRVSPFVLAFIALDCRS